MDPILFVKNLRLSFPSGKDVFDEASLDLFSQESVGLWSPNGTGKTSLFRVITGLLKPETVELNLEGKNITSTQDFKELRMKVGYVLQHPDDQLFFPQVIDDVAFGPLNQRKSVREAAEISEATLRSLGIENLKNALSFELSGGQKKLVTLACVLSMQPKILLLDEPTNGLDETARQRLIDVINGIEAAKIIISHDPEVLTLTCTRFLTIQNKKIIEVGKPMAHQHTHRHFYGSFPHSHE